MSKLVNIPLFNIKYISFKKSGLKPEVKKILAKTGRFTVTLKGCQITASSTNFGASITENVTVIANAGSISWKSVKINW